MAYNSRFKVYNTFGVVQVAANPIFGASDKPKRKKRPSSDPDKLLALENAKARARSAIFDICMCNRFEWFFTWTISPDQINRYDAKEVYRHLADFLRNISRRKGFRYVCVPERHKDGAIHLHGLCILGSVKVERAHSPYDGHELVDDVGRPVYNMTDWRFGFSTCVPLDSEYDRTVTYITKYIRKDMSEKVFGKWYLSSRDLKKVPDIVKLEGETIENRFDPQKVIDGVQHVVYAGEGTKILSEVVRYD